MKNLLLILLLIPAMSFYYNDATGQAITIRGAVYDYKGEVLRSVTVSLLHSKDSTLVKADLSGDSGVFEIICNASGSFLLSYTAVGFETRFSDHFEVKAGETIDMPAVHLKIQARELQDVTVSSRRQLITVKPDKTVFNVQNSINASGSNALELLQKSPGVTIDNNDNISMKGKMGVRIYVDERMIQLSAEDLAAYLKSINSNDIESIEMITNPGSRYDASGNAGIINFRLRKNNNIGMNGSFTTGLVQGVTPKGNASINLNYRNKKINLFMNAGSSHGRYETDIIAPRSQKDTLYDQHLLQLSYNTSYNVKAGVDYFINKQQTIGIMNTSGYNLDDWTSYGNTAIFYMPSNTYIKRLTATNAIPRKRTNISTNLNYRFADTSGRELNIDLDHGLYRGRALSYQPNYYIDKDEKLLAEVITYNNTPTDIDIYTGKIDVTLPVVKGKLGFGAKTSYVKTNNTVDFFVENGSITKVPDRSYNFVYKEFVNAAYINYQRKFSSKWGLQAGLRTEHTRSEGVLVRGDGVLQSDNNTRRDYLDLFPNVVFSWSPNMNNNLHLSYSRRIDRPNYQGLNPFELKLDELSYVKGNSFLRPQYTDNLELSHTWKNKVNTSVGYSHVKDFSTQTVDTLNNYTYAYAKNLATQKIVSFNVGTPLNITKWWTAFVNCWINYQVFNGKVNVHTVDMDIVAAGAFAQQTFVLGNDYTAEMTSWVNGPSALGPTLKAKSMGAVDVGLQKLVFKKKGTVKLIVTDVFRTSVPFRAGTDFGGLVLNFRVTRESQTAKISFSYRFGNNKVKAARQRQSGLENESKRIREN
ncbi:MAG TPA: TonB-dependent receptor [Chitinophagaceae bacterium]